MFTVLVNGEYFVRDDSHFFALQTALSVRAKTVSIVCDGEVVTTINRH